MHIDSSISNNSVLHEYSFFCLHTAKCKNSSISNNSVLHKYIFQMSKTVLLQAIQFSQQI